MKKTFKLFGCVMVLVLFSSMNVNTNNSAGATLWMKNILEKLEVSDYYATLTPEGSMAVTGSFVDKTKFGNKALVAAGSYDIFVAKYTPDGALLWLKQGGGNEFDMANVIRCDTVGNIYVTGYITGLAFFGDYILLSKGQRNVFTIKYDPNGEIVWLRAEGADLYYETNPKKRSKIMARIVKN
jgi:hypothetical protein